MKIRDYIKSELVFPISDAVVELSKEVAGMSDEKKLEYLKMTNSEIDKVFLEIISKTGKLENFYQKVLSEILETLEVVDKSFLDREIPNHLK